MPYMLEANPEAPTHDVDHPPTLCLRGTVLTDCNYNVTSLRVQGWDPEKSVQPMLWRSLGNSTQFDDHDTRAKWVSETDEQQRLTCLQFAHGKFMDSVAASASGGEDGPPSFVLYDTTGIRDYMRGIGEAQAYLTECMRQAASQLELPSQLPSQLPSELPSQLTSHRFGFTVPWHIFPVTWDLDPRVAQAREGDPAEVGTWNEVLNIDVSETEL